MNYKIYIPDQLKMVVFYYIVFDKTGMFYQKDGGLLSAQDSIQLEELLEEESRAGSRYQRKVIPVYDTTIEVMQEETTGRTTLPEMELMTLFRQKAEELSEDNFPKPLEEVQVQMTTTIVPVLCRLHFDRGLSDVEISKVGLKHYQGRQYVLEEHGELRESVNIVESELSIRAALQQ